LRVLPGPGAVAPVLSPRVAALAAVCVNPSRPAGDVFLRALEADSKDYHR
jgi:hypothetical protein